MVAKPQNEKAGRGRAGMPLARAERLASQAAARNVKEKSATPAIAGTLAVVFLGLGGYFYTSGAPNAAVAMAEEPQAAVVAEAPVIPEPEPQPMPVAAEPAVPAPAPAPAVQTAPAIEVFAPRPALPPCVNNVERQLARLYQADATDAQWDLKRNYIRETVQAVLDCDLANFTLSGDFELAGSELADLQVSWDREAAMLTLAVIESTGNKVTPAILTNDGQPIAFLVH